jgi:hypothetical protein
MRIVCMHGSGQQVAGDQSLFVTGPRSLGRLAGGPAMASGVVMGFCGHLLCPAGERLAVGDPRFISDDVEPGLEEDRLPTWRRGPRTRN